MAEWWRWPLALSLGLHALAVGWGFWRPEAGPRQVLTDFWAGKTFEAPELAEELGAGADTQGIASSEQMSPSEGRPAQPVPNDPADKPTPANKAAAPGNRPPKTMAGHDPATTPARAGSVPESSEFGAEGAAAGLRDLLRSFVRAIPAAASSDPAWATVPMGPAGTADLTLVLDQDAKLHTLAPLDASVPPHLRRLILKTLMVLSGGRFAVSGEGPALQKLRIAAAVTQLPAPPEGQAESGGVFGLGFEPPDRQGVTRGFFTLGSGRHIEVTVRVSR